MNTELPSYGFVVKLKLDNFVSSWTQAVLDMRNWLELEVGEIDRTWAWSCHGDCLVVGFIDQIKAALFKLRFAEWL